MPMGQSVEMPTTLQKGRPSTTRRSCFTRFWKTCFKFTKCHVDQPAGLWAQQLRCRRPEEWSVVGWPSLPWARRRLPQPASSVQGCPWGSRHLQGLPQSQASSPPSLALELLSGLPLGDPTPAAGGDRGPSWEEQRGRRVFQDGELGPHGRGAWQGGSVPS